MITQRHRLCATSGLLALMLSGAALASSHREAPSITETPKVDATDFYFFRSYESGRSGYVTVIADYIPFQDPQGGPNFFQLDANAYYDINFDLNADGKPDVGFRFRFFNTQQDIQLNVGTKKVSIPLINAGTISANSPTANLNVVQTYQVSMITYAGNSATGQPLTNASTGGLMFTKPVDDIGNKSIPDYPSYAKQYIYNANMPSSAPSGCTAARIFVGQRKDPFVINVGETFDLVNIQHPVGEQYAKSAKDDLALKNVTSLVMEIPIACIKGNDNVTGAWTAASKVVGTYTPPTLPTLTQVSRLGNPLVNEVVIGLKDKDKFNASVPSDDAQFSDYVTNPTLPALIETLYPTVPAPTQFPRQDLVATFLTGLPNINKPTQYQITPSEEMRLNLSTAPVAVGTQNRLGAIAGDTAGYPNGRRPGDDVVDISLRVAMGKLYAMGLFGGADNAPAGTAELTDGAYVDSTYFDTTFPYLRSPIPGSPQSVSMTPVTPTP